jgi:ubiquinone/menaquinone biosynthesis C-methylase UbiE
MSGTERAANLSVYRDPEVVAHYSSLDYLTPCERILFETFLKPGIALLDLGVGGGRTTPYLSGVAGYYAGIDYAEEMVRVCRDKFPELQFEVADAADLSMFAEASFDAVVFSFNGIDYLAPDEKRHECLRECHRVLKPGGVLIFSSHNPQSLVVGWDWDWNRMRASAGRITQSKGFLWVPALAGLACAKAGLSFWRALVRSLPRALRRIRTRTFWRGEGYLFDPSHGGLMTHCGVPTFVLVELNQHRFKFLQQLPEDYPQPGRQWRTRWYYYAFSKD